MVTKEKEVEMASDIMSPSPDGGGDSGDGCSGDGNPANLSSEGNSTKGSKCIDPKCCGVCGDKALGNNFNAITCESCKAFFRRNALRTKEFVCPFSNNCKVDAITRRFCQRCRLKKCFDIGMKKEWIMTDEEKKLKKQKIEQNRLKRTSLENTGGNSNEEQDLLDSPPAAKVHITEEHHVQRLILNSGGGGETVVLDTPKLVQKQPMMPHNPNNASVPNRMAEGKDPSYSELSGRSVLVGSKERNSMLEISVNSMENGNVSSSYSLAGNEESASEGSFSPLNNQQVSVVMRCGERASPHTWVEPPPVPEEEELGDSPSNSPLPIKYPPIKRHILEEKMSGSPPVKGEQETNEDIDSGKMPLLSSLIRPGHSESPTDTFPISSTATPSSRVDCDEAHKGIIPQTSPSCPVADNSRLAPTSQQYILDESSSTSPPSNKVRHHRVDNHDQSSNDYYASNDYPVTSYHHSHLQSGGDALPLLSSLQPQPSPQYEQASEYDSYETIMQMRESREGSRDGHVHPHCRGHHTTATRAARERSSEGMRLLNTMDSILSVAIAAEFNSFSMLGGNSKELNKAEQAKLNELLLASQALHAPVDAERPIKASETADATLMGVINLTEIAIRRLIKMSKKISGFKNMCQEDQIALLKGGCTEMMILRSASTYDPDRDSWQIPHSNPGYNINLGVLKEARGNLYEEHQRFVKSFQPQWRKDENIMIILCAITLFTPERLNVVHKDVVKLEQDSYYYLLKRYLESTLNGCEAKSTYLQLIRKIAELRVLNSNHVRVFLEVNPKEVEPLLIEIFDLK